MRLLITYILVFIPLLSMAQAIDNTMTYSSLGNRYIRFTYDNDFFTATDRYYTQGIQLEFASPAFQKAFYNKALISPLKGSEINGLAIEHNAYTPTNIIPDVILYNDHPYTAALMLRAFRIVNDTTRLRRFSSTLSVGVLGAHASGKWMQESIHRWLDNVQPGGWKYQLKNDIILNYNINYEHNLLAAGNNFLLNADASLAAGTLNDRLSIGFNFMAGYFNSPYRNSKKGFRTYIYAHPQASLVAYDATLQGGMFTKNNIYSIPAKDIERLVFSGRAGIVFNIAGIYLEHFYAISTKQFTTQKTFGWGGIQIGVGF